MSGARIVFPEFRDEQSDSRYPFKDTATLKATSGAELARDTFLDAALYPINATAPLYISSITVTTNSVTITVSDVTQNDVCSATYTPLNPPTTGTLALRDTYGRPAGVLVATRTQLALIGGWEPKTHNFNAGAAEFVSGVCYPAKEPGVRGLLLNETQELITDDIWLIGRDGVVVRADPPASNTIRVDIVGVPLFKRRDCLDADLQPVGTFVPKTLLQTINGNPPDEFGNFNITVSAQSPNDTVLRVYPENGVLKITTVGSKVL